jgi:hypothetical protein
MVYGTQEFAELLKDIIEDNKRHGLYDVTVAHAKAMSVHIYGDKPLYLLERSRPREEDDVKTYRIDNYEPTTKAGADKSIDICSKIFNPTLYGIRWKEQNKQIEELKEYTFSYFPKYNSLMNFNKEVAFRKMFADPNAIECIKPGPIPKDQTQRMQPEIVIYGSENVWYYDEDHYLAFIKKVDVKDNNGSLTRCQYYFDYFDKNMFVNFYAWYDSSSRVVHIEPIREYVTNWGEIPVRFLKGKSKGLDNGEIMYESFFSSALPHWNLTVIHESDLLGAFINHMHPQKYELTDECNYQMKWAGQSYACTNGKVVYPGGKDGASISNDCPHCLGTGYTTVKSPYGTYQFNRQKLADGEPSGLQPVGYITIPVEATKLLKEHTIDMNRKALWSINMDIEDSVGENQSGVAKVIDRSAQHDTIFNIACVVFDDQLPNQYYFINKYMFLEEANSTKKDENVNLPEISKPTMFDILSTSDLINNFKVATESKLDRNFLRMKQVEIISRDMSTNTDLKNYLISMIDLDPLFGYTMDEIDLGVAKGVIRKIDWSIHDNLKAFIDKAIEENKEFLNLSKPEKLAKLEQYADELIKAEQPRLDESAMQKIEMSQQDAA